VSGEEEVFSPKEKKGDDQKKTKRKRSVTKSKKSRKAEKGVWKRRTICSTGHDHGRQTEKGAPQGEKVGVTAKEKSQEM